MRRLRRIRGSPRRRLHRLSARCTPPRSSRRRSTGASTAAPRCGFGRQPLPARQHQDAMDRPRRPDRRRRWRLAPSGLGAAQGSSARVGRITAAWRPGPTTRGFIQKEQPAPTLPKMSRAGNALSAPERKILSPPPARRRRGLTQRPPVSAVSIRSARKPWARAQNSLCGIYAKRRPGGGGKYQHIRNNDRRCSNEHAVNHPEQRSEHLNAPEQ